MKLINLSLIPKFWELTTDEVVNYCLDNDIDTIRDNFSDYKIEYTLSDLTVVIEPIFDSNVSSSDVETLVKTVLNKNRKSKTVWENIRDRGVDYLKEQELKIKINYLPKDYED